jgi:NHL repeat
VTRVSLAPRATCVREVPHTAPQWLLDPCGARVLLGSDDMATPIAPAADTLFGPRGACLVDERGPLVVCDTGHHRLLIWTRMPEADNAPADLLIGQPAFDREGRNARAAVDANTLNVPTGVAYDGGVLAVADAWNHRVLLWHGFPDASNRPADVVLGQSDARSGHANRGRPAPCADTLHWCYGVAIDRGRLFVADTGNRRVLVWDHIPITHGRSADLVLGQRDFTTRDDNADLGGGAAGMRWPHGIAFAGERLIVADAGLNRVMIWNGLPGCSGAPCDAVLGQADFNGRDHNRAGYNPTAATLNMPYGVAVRGATVMVADTANSRLLGFDVDNLATGRPAVRLAGQRAFNDKGDNRWGSLARDSLCWPYAVSACNNTVVVADSGNNRVLLWQAACL